MGLNDGARRDSVFNLVRDIGTSVVCLQETKLAAIDRTMVLHERDWNATHGLYYIAWVTYTRAA